MSLYFLNFDPTCWNTDAIEFNIYKTKMLDSFSLVFIAHTSPWIYWVLCYLFAGSISFQVVPGGSRLFQLAPRFSMYDHEAQSLELFLSKNKEEGISNNNQI